MPTAVHIPRINNNDDEVKLVELRVAAGDRVEAGQVLAIVETDKAMVDVEAPESGFVIGVRAEPDTVARVGSVLLWLGAGAEEAPPAEDMTGAGSRTGTGAEPTAKARMLLARYGLVANQVPSDAARLSADDVERWVLQQGLRPIGEGALVREIGDAGKAPAGKDVSLAPHERGMLATVSWHRDEAVPGYIELSFDAAPWIAYAQAFRAAHRLMLDPLLSLLAFKVVQLAATTPKLNATIVGQQRREFESINLGFTVQAGEVLYLTVLRNAGQYDELAFVNRLIELQRSAAGHGLAHTETHGATIGFSSMARWKVGRHIPILSPYTALMVAHAVDGEGRFVLGATYDHRVLHGGEVAQTLRKLSSPPSAG